MQESGEGWEVCVVDVDDCGLISNFRGRAGKLTSHDINGRSIDGTLLVGDSDPAVEGAWGGVILRTVDVASGSLFAVVDVEAGPVALSVRNGEVAYRTVDGEELDAAMTSIPGDIAPGSKATFGISVSGTTELAGELEISIRSSDGAFDDTVVVRLTASGP